MVRHAANGVRRVGRYLSLIGAVLLLAVQLLIGSVGVSPKAAALSSCSVSSLDPHQAPDGSETGFVFTVTSSTDAIAWIQVVSPSANAVLTSASSDWLPTVTFTSSQATFSGSAINPGNPIQVSVAAQISYFPASSWVVKASNSADGSNPGTCSGDTSISVVNNNPPNILSISTNASSRSAVVNWSTDKPTTSEVDYGTTISYGGQLTDGSYVTSHSLTITGLTPATTYHYQVQGTDQEGFSVVSADSTFFTAAEPVNTTTSPSSNTQPTTPVTQPQDKVPPTITFTTVPPKIVNTEPTFAGTAADDVAVTKIEYSVDGGKDWASADKATGLNTKKATFSFTPVNLEDDTYIMLARAIDAGGNTTQTAAVQVVVDRRPPIIGGTVLTMGPQIVLPDKQGIITMLPGVSATLTLSATGGITSAEVRASSASSKSSSSVAAYALHQASNNGLWSGTVSFSKTGSYILTAHAKDGADNVTDRVIARVIVSNPGNIISRNGPINGATVTAYYLDPDTGSWVVWDGQPYGQRNPQTTDSHGAFDLLLPAGKFYLNAIAKGYRGMNSESFTLARPTPVAMALHLDPKPFGLGSRLPTLSLETEPAAFYATRVSITATAGPQDLINATLPAIALPNISGKTENSISWLGKPTVLSMLSTWDPATTEQLAALQKLSTDSDINVKVVGMQEGVARLRAFNAIDNSQLNWLSDRYGETAAPLNISSVPTHYFIDRKGVIRAISYGVLSYDQLVQNVSSLQ